MSEWPAVWWVHLTAGAPQNHPDRTAYRAARLTELAQAASLAGVAPERRILLDVPDQATIHHLPGIVTRLEEIFSAIRPSLVLTHPYEGGHPDHDTAAFAVSAALQKSQAPPEIVEFASYHNEPPYDGARLETGCFLPAPGTEEVEIRLSPEQQRRKQTLLECFVSQREMIANFPTGQERFRPAPLYDFAQPPHPGRLYYDTQPWGVSSADWRARASDYSRRNS